VPRRRQESILDDAFDLLKITPTWVGPVLAAVVFALFRFFIPLFIPAKQSGVDTGAIMRPLMSMFSWLMAGAVLAAWILAEIWKLMNRRLLDSQTGLASIKNISWREFERLVSEAFRRRGYLAEVVGSESGDGGVDIRLTGPGETVLVQCKQWKAYKVGVTTVRELLGVVVSERADRGIVVTSGRFTQEAKAFAQANPQIKLINGPELAELIRGVQVGSGAPPIQPPMPPAASKAPSCPSCGAEMVLRTARKGQNAGSQFWGCPKYPACPGTKPYSHVQRAQDGT
jgi:restriction system protein